MKKKYLFILALTACLSVPSIAWASSHVVHITGEVKQPLSLSPEDLERFQTTRVQLNEVLKDGTYKGTFYYRGVPLRTLLDTASIEKQDSTFNKNNDLAIKVQSRGGRTVSLSWGEVYYRNSDDILIAVSASPIRPHKSCGSCHEKAFYEPRMAQLDRSIGFPKLVVSDDGFSDRCIEDIVNIEVVDPSHGLPVDRSATLQAPALKITGLVKKEMTVTDLSSYPYKKLQVVHLGEGRGFHGVSGFSGPSFAALLDEAGIEDDLAGIFLVSAPDGYRSSFSFGELFLTRSEPSTIMAYQENGKPIDNGGKFFLIPNEDLMSDRCVKSVQLVEVLTLK